MSDIQSIQLSTHGAELQSLIVDGREYLWHGDPDYWKRRAPILFPIVGRLANDTLRIDGREYPMKQHGFARDAEFVERDGWYVLVEEGRDNYPYTYELAVQYVINGNILTSNWQVKNFGDKIMHFQIGAHPAFMLPDYDASAAIHGYLRCYNADGKIVLPIANTKLVDGLRQETVKRVICDKNALIPITNNTFADDAILLEGCDIASIALVDMLGKEVFRVSCPQAEVFGLWAPNKPGCPFVCIEPWCGIADKAGFNGDISERDYIHSLEPGDNFEFCYSLTVNL